MLDEARRTQAWREKATDLREWIDAVAKDLGISASGLRRAMYMVGYHRVLTAELEKHKRPAPSLGQLPASVSAESLEILKRLGRHLPDGEFFELADDVLAGKVSRTQLQTRWRLVRDEDGSERTGSDDGPGEGNRRGELMSRFIAEGKRWLADAKPERYALFTDVTLKTSSELIRFDLVAVIGGPDGATALHAIFVPSDMPEADLDARLSAMSLCADFVWVLGPDPLGFADTGWIDPESLTVRRQADALSPTLSTALATELIFRSRAR
jgi:hypothetical protein